jgi:hypothetical protein
VSTMVHFLSRFSEEARWLRDERMSIPAFFAAARFGTRLLVIMALCFSLATIATYIVTCVPSGAALQRLSEQMRDHAAQQYGAQRPVEGARRRAQRL